ncbi:amidohydrolase [Streptomyces sp. TM32]|uniref:amidohydrolase family protein n=1 Tax=Streptomyces sp. TM32 TaxID=1652669 RepID=UPI00101064FE|nr:amidohydrolase family protein [Streptomyces sp. TM32]RXS64277.1 amidohydrolase [Streptomyces sp. TM32]
MRIDIHAHLWSEAYLDLLERFGNTATGIHRGVGAGPGEQDLEERFALMASAGVDLQVLSSAPASPHFADQSNAVQAARMVNDEYADMVRRFPDRFQAFASLPWPHTDAALAELDRALTDLSMPGAVVTTSVLGRSLADPTFLPLYAELDRRAAVLFVHPAGAGAHSPLIGPTMTWEIGAPIEDTVAATHLIQTGIPSRFPRLKIIIGHLGGALPMLMERMDRQYGWEAPATPEKPSVTARRMWYETTGHNHTPALRAAAETLGADRLVLGTDFSYQAGDAFGEAVTYVQRAGLPDQDVNAILDTTAAELLGVTHPAAI